MNRPTVVARWKDGEWIMPVDFLTEEQEQRYGRYIRKIMTPHRNETYPDPSTNDPLKGRRSGSHRGSIRILLSEGSSLFLSFWGGFHVPSHGLHCEESGLQLGASSYCWVIDPLDGTMNFFMVILIFVFLLHCSEKPPISLVLSINLVPTNYIQQCWGMGLF